MQLVAVNNIGSLYWVPCHLSFHRNKVADEFARNDSSIPFVGPKSAIRISSNLRNMVFDLLRVMQYLN